VAKEKDVQSVIGEETTVVGWFSNHQLPLAKLREATKDLLHKACELVKAGATRFGTHTLVGERLLTLKGPLQRTVVDPEYAAQKYKDKGDSEEATGTGRVFRTNKGATATKLVLDNGGFWDRVDKHVTVTKPMFKMLRRFDSSAPAVGKLYSSWFELGEHLKQQTGVVDYASTLSEKHDVRWAYGHSDISSAAYCLDPEFIDHSQSSNAEVTDGFMNVAEKIGILRAVRAAIDGYLPRFKERRAFIGDDPSKLKSYDKFPDYPDKTSPLVEQFCQKVNEQLTLYRQKKGTFSRDWVMKSAENQPAYLWWDANGGSVPELQFMARLILAQPASASICERINSEFAFVKDPRRNRLEHGKASKLVALFHNLRLLRRMKKPNYVEPAIGWNNDDEKSGVTKYGVAHYEPLKLGAKMKTVPAPARPALPAPDAAADTVQALPALM
jgi:hypothetical protein